MESDTDNYTCDFGACAGSWGGTSFAAPRWAGFLALVNEQAAAGGAEPLGFANSALYSLGKETGSQFHDITSGNNPSITDSSVLFQAVPGYDLVTGLGSPAGQPLIDALAPWSNTGFQLSLAATSLSINPGSTGSLQIGIVSHNGFEGAVSLTVTGLPSGVTATWSANPVSNGSVLTFTAESDLPRGQYQITVSGVSGKLSARGRFTLLVNAPGFSITPLSMSFPLYGGTSDSITFTVNGFAGFADPVNYSITSALPPGISAVWNTGRDRPVMLTVSAASNAQPGLYDLTVMANSGKLTSSATIQMRVLAPGYVINLTPVPTAIAQGGSFTGTVSLALEGGFNGAVSLTAPQFPQGVSVTFNPPSISGTQTSQLTLAVSGSAPVGPAT